MKLNVTTGPLRQSSALVSVFSLALVWSWGPSTCSAEQTFDRNKVSFKTIGDSMILIPVQVNGAGPFNFLLDTGTTRTMVDEKLAKELSLSRVNQTTQLTGFGGTSTAALLQIDSLFAAGETVHNLHLSVGKSFPGGVRGILGEDFLSRFDVLIDYRQHLLVLSADSTSLASSLGGEHIPIGLHGMFRGSPTLNRIVLTGRAMELGARALSLLLDSGTNSFVLFPSSTNGLMSTGAEDALMRRTPELVGGQPISRKKVNFLFLGSRSVSNVSAAIASSGNAIDVDGIVPAAWFDSLFLCHTGGYVILNPSLVRAPK